MRPRRRLAMHWALASSAFALAAGAGRVQAQVIEIAPSGDTLTISQPSVFTPDGVATIADVAPASSTNVGALLQAEAARQQLDPHVVSAVAWRESHFQQSALSTKDAVGVMQLTRATAQTLGVDRYDLAQNIRGGVTYLHSLIDRYRDLNLALAAYNAGPGAVDRYHGVPPYPETQSYVRAIVGRLGATASVSIK